MDTNGHEFTEANLICGELEIVGQTTAASFGLIWPSGALAVNRKSRRSGVATKFIRVYSCPFVVKSARDGGGAEEDFDRG